MPSSATSATASPQPVERELVLARHRGDLAPEVRAVVDEQRVDQVVDRQPVLADEVAEPGMAAEPAGAVERDSRRRAGMSCGWSSSRLARAAATSGSNGFALASTSRTQRPRRRAVAVSMAVAVAVVVGAAAGVAAGPRCRWRRSTR